MTQTLLLIVNQGVCKVSIIWVCILSQKLVWCYYFIEYKLIKILSTFDFARKLDPTG